MDIIRGKAFTAPTAWGSRLIATMNGITTRIHWTDQPYRWHINDGEEVFVVLDGEILMYYKEAGDEHQVLLQVGDIFYASVGTEHVAHPKGEARILVVETQGSA
jgi:mannose-6-phosphate isomerase-like protein (cupin superfamily)